MPMIYPAAIRRHLRTLSLCEYNSFAPVFWNATSCETLEVLCLGLTENFTAEIVAEKLELCSNLKALSIAMDNSPFEEFANIIQSCPQIEHLELNGGRHVPEFACIITETLPYLKTIFFHECYIINEVLAALADRDDGAAASRVCRRRLAGRLWRGTEHIDE